MFKLLALVILLTTQLTASHPDVDDLLAVIVVFRHGDRSPVKIYPKDPYDATQWPMGLGQLTNQGKRRHYELGKWFRDRYDGFLSQQYNSTEIKIFTTDVDRTYMSAASNLAGLYPPEGDQAWDENIRWQPIPIHKADIDIISGDTVCPKFETLFNNLIADNSYYSAEDNTERLYLYSYLSAMTGTQINTLSDVLMIRDSLFVESHNHLPLPDWAYDVYPEKLQPLADLYYAAYGYTPALARLTAGPFLNNVIEHFNNVSKGINDELPKFVMYSGHDTNVASVLSGLGAFEPHCPYFASTVIFELRQSTDGPIVQTFYKSQDDMLPIRLEGCRTLCTLDSFKANLANIAIGHTQWISECFGDNSVMLEKTLKTLYRTSFPIT